MPKRVINIVLVFLAFCMMTFVTSCDSSNKLLILNWGEYINMDLVEAFEEEYNCEVVVSLADSNDLFYSKVKSGTTVYDLVVPSDYMVEKMYLKGMLQPIEYSRLGFDTYDDYLATFVPGVRGIINEMESEVPGVKDYFVPYFWGTWGIMYNKATAGLEDSINQAIADGNPWKVLFSDSAVPAGTKVGMYETSRYAYAAAMFYNGKSPNDDSNEALALAKTTLYSKKFTSWATDTLKKDIKNENLDLGFMWTGDYLDMLYEELTEKTLDEITIDICIPDDTVAFCDNLVLLKNARHTDLAYEFIKYFLQSKVAYDNASIVGYCTPNLGAYNEITRYAHSISTYEELVNILPTSSNLEYYRGANSVIVRGTDASNNDFIVEISMDEFNGLAYTFTENMELAGSDVVWLRSWAYAVDKYYPKTVDNAKGFKGQVLANLDRSFIDKINTICNNAKVN